VLGALRLFLLVETAWSWRVSMEWDVVVVGAGAAGLVAAERAASCGRRTLLLEKNRKPGVKILISGGTRCNLTHATDVRGIVTAYAAQGRFLHSALAALGPADVVALVEQEGVPTKIEETGKIFPVSDRAADVVQAFVARLRRSGAELALAEPLSQLLRDREGFLLTTNRRTLRATHVILTTGGLSYPGCGTTGDGYAWARALGHTIVPTRPALVPITTIDAWVRELSGITIPDVELKVVDRANPKRPLDARRGSLLFAHFGLTGPVALDISRAISGHAEPSQLELLCDFLPAASVNDLEAHIRSGLEQPGKKTVLSLVPELLPRRLAEQLLRAAGLDPDGRLAELSKAGRIQLIPAWKQARIGVHGTRGYAKAEVTAGGVSLSEVDSRDMQSKVAPGLYLAGEILDLDGPIGGYNFQAAFSTGWLAGMSA
jgi:predicted Rossmann fold flavoprotein